MNCPNCNYLLPPNSKFCNECGCNISTAGSALEQERTLSDDQTIMGPGEGGHGPQDGRSPAASSHYQVLDKIGQGGMGTVYRARDTKLDIDVALKRLSSEMADSEQGVRRFLNEAKTIAQLNHQNIVRVHTIDEDAEGPFIVMELIEGQDLGALIKLNGKLGLDEAMALLHGICNGMSYAHKRGVIHRDIKPSNILLMSDGTPKLVDFGLARIGRESDLSMTGYGLGTMSYMPPEQKRDAKSADHRSDIFALAKTFYHMVTGEVPDAVDVDEFPEKLRPAMKKALKPKPEDRFFSVDEFWQALEQANQSTEPSADTSSQQDMEDACPECGHRNEPQAQYCKKCGSGLFEACPNPDCGSRQRRGESFCQDCGANIPDYRQYVDHLRAAEDFWDKKKYSRMQKELRSAVALVPGDEQAAALQRRLDERLTAVESLRSTVESSSPKREPELVLESLAELRRLDPDAPGYRETEASAQEGLEERARQRQTQRRIRTRKRIIAGCWVLAAAVFIAGGVWLFGSNRGAHGLDEQRQDAKVAEQSRDAEGPPRSRTDDHRPMSVEREQSSAPVARPAAGRHEFEPAMVTVPAGQFVMGSPSSEADRDDDESPRRTVRIRQSFSMARTEVTQEQYRAVMGLGSREFKGKEYPVEAVSWRDCIEYCNRLSERAGLTPAYRTTGGEVIWDRQADGYRLPTEAEWEYACRAGATTRFGSGTRTSGLGDAAWHGVNAGGGTHPVGLKNPNAWGLFDMHGNVWEWCWDYYSTYIASDTDDPTGPEWGSHRVLRGGSWFSKASDCRSANRYHKDPRNNNMINGFRVVRGASSVEAHSLMDSSGLQQIESRLQEEVGAAGWAVWIGSFPDRSEADEFRDRLRRRGMVSSLRKVDIEDKGTWYRVYSGSFSTRQQADDACDGVKELLKQDWAVPVRF